MKTKQLKREEAKERQERYNKLGKGAKLAQAEGRRGNSTREVKRINS